jgi:hypothetical protein
MPGNEAEAAALLDRYLQQAREEAGAELLANRPLRIRGVRRRRERLAAARAGQVMPQHFRDGAPGLERQADVLQEPADDVGQLTRLLVRAAPPARPSRRRFGAASRPGRLEPSVRSPRSSRSSPCLPRSGGRTRPAPPPRRRRSTAQGAPPPRPSPASPADSSPPAPWRPSAAQFGARHWRSLDRAGYCVGGECRGIQALCRRAEPQRCRIDVGRTRRRGEWHLAIEQPHSRQPTGPEVALLVRGTQPSHYAANLRCLARSAPT